MYSIYSKEENHSIFTQIINIVFWIILKLQTNVCNWTKKNLFILQASWFRRNLRILRIILTAAFFFWDFQLCLSNIQRKSSKELWPISRNTFGPSYLNKPGKVFEWLLTIFVTVGCFWIIGIGDNFQLLFSFSNVSISGQKNKKLFDVLQLWMITSDRKCVFDSRVTKLLLNSFETIEC